MARALSKAGGVARQAAQSITPSSATPNGRPQQAQDGPSRKVTLLQQGAQKPVSATGPRQPMQSGGNSRSSSALATGGAIAANLARMADLPNMEGRRPLFDFSAASRARSRAMRLGGDRFLDAAALEGLCERLSAVTRRFERGLWIGQALPEPIRPYAREWYCADFGADEVLQAQAPFDLAVSLFSLQWINDLPGALIQINRLLRPDGLFLAALMGGATLSELREAFAQGEIQTRGGVSPRVAPFADVRDLGALLQRAGFALPVADVERQTVRYGDFTALVRDLRTHGFTNMLSERSKRPLRRDTLAAL